MKKTNKEIKKHIYNNGLKVDHKLKRDDYSEDEWNSILFEHYKNCYEKYDKLVKLEPGKQVLINVVIVEKYGITLEEYMKKLLPDALIYKEFIDEYKNKNKIDNSFYNGTYEGINKKDKKE